MKRAPRPKPPLGLRRLAAWSLLCAGLLPAAGWAQTSSTYATRDGRIVANVMTCASTDGSFTAQPCGVTGSPMHVTVDGTPSGNSAAGTAAAQLHGVQGGGAGALPVGVSQAGSWAVAIANLPATQAVSAASLPLPAGAATAANQAALNADGGSQVHLMNPLPTGSNTIGTVIAANRSAAWTDASLTATATATVPSALAATASRTALHVWNVGTATACLNYGAAAAASGSNCAAGSVPIPAGSAYLEDQPGNVSPEAISLVCAGTACPLTVKVR